jgi:hypothetical protein
MTLFWASFTVGILTGGSVGALIMAFFAGAKALREDELSAHEKDEMW